MFQSKFSKKNTAKEVRTVRHYRCYYPDGSVLYGSEMVTESKSVCKEATNYSCPRDEFPDDDGSSPRLTRDTNTASLDVEPEPGSEAVITINPLNKPAVARHDPQVNVEPSEDASRPFQAENVATDSSDTTSNDGANTDSGFVSGFQEAEEGEEEDDDVDAVSSGFRKISDSVENLAKSLSTRRQLSDISSDDLVSRARSDDCKLTSNSDFRSTSYSEGTTGRTDDVDMPRTRLSEERGNVESVTDRVYARSHDTTGSRDSLSNSKSPDEKLESRGIVDYESSDSDFDIFCAKRRWSKDEGEVNGDSRKKWNDTNPFASPEQSSARTESDQIAAMDPEQRPASAENLESRLSLSPVITRRRVSFTRFAVSDGESDHQVTASNRAGETEYLVIHPWDRKRWSDSAVETERPTSAPSSNDAAENPATEEEIEQLVPDEPPKRSVCGTFSCGKKGWSYSCQGCCSVFPGKHPSGHARNGRQVVHGFLPTCAKPCGHEYHNAERKRSDGCVGVIHTGCGFPCVKEMVEFFDRKALEYQCKMESDAARRRSGECPANESALEPADGKLPLNPGGESSSATSCSDSDSEEEEDDDTGTGTPPLDDFLNVPSCDMNRFDAEYYNLDAADENVKFTPPSGHGGFQLLCSSFTVGENVILITLHVLYVIAVTGAIIYALYANNN